MGRGFRPQRCRGGTSHFNPLAPHGARRSCETRAVVAGRISTHSPRVGRDKSLERCPQRGRNFNPLAPRGARRCCENRAAIADTFQSTRPAWGETTRCRCNGQALRYFNPLAPPGARPKHCGFYINLRTFQSTRPRGARLGQEAQVGTENDISTHSPRVGRDRAEEGYKPSRHHFNPLALGRVRQDVHMSHDIH